MKRRFLLTIAMSASLVSFGAFAADKPSDQSGNRGAAPSGGSGNVETAHAGGMSFKDLDRDSDGKISWAEANMDPTLTEQFPQYDRNGDGILTESEFGAVGAGPSGGASNSQTPSGSSSNGSTGGSSK